VSVAAALMASDSWPRPVVVVVVVVVVRDLVLLS